MCLLFSCAAAWADAGTLHGRVLDPQGASVAAAKVKVTNAAGIKLGETLSDQNGNFVLAAIDPGVYQVTAEESSHVTVVASVTITSGQQQQITLQFAQGLTQLSGTVVDASGAVIAGAAVMVRSADGTVQRLTPSDSNGSFSISGLSAGNYQLIVSEPGFETKEMPVTIGTIKETAPLRIALAVSALSTTVQVQGREDSLVGIADSATQGTVGQSEIEDRPILRSGEILETVPGLIITQHAGGGKANQYFLRGFNLDHGTDFAVFLDGMPLNLPSHAHGEGYSDMNTVIPEFVQRLNFEKGPYYADIGNYSSAGSANIQFYKTLPQNFFTVEGGMYGFARAVFGVSQKLGSGTLLYGGEAYYDNGPWVHPDAYAKFNGLLTYSQGSDAEGFSFTARAYHGKWDSSDQIPITAVPLVGFLGALNPTDGGNSQRYSLQGEWHRQGANSATAIMAYGFYYDLDLFSDFTYYLDDPIKGDQFEQKDNRWVTGVAAAHTIFSQWFGRKVENTFGVQVRNDWVHNGLYRTEDRMRTDKNDSNACNEEPIPECANDPNLTAILPADTDVNKFTDTMLSFYVENKAQWTEKFRSVVALRGDEAIYVVNNLTPSYVASELPGAPVINFAELNSGTATKFLPSPKASLIFGPWAKTEFYLQGGFSFHSNDARGATQRVEPISPDYPFPTPTTPISPLVQTKGAEVGVRTVAVPHLQSTFSLWYLHSNSELQQDGDTGGTIPSEQSSNRYGIELANYYTPREHLAFDLDFADSRALFTQIDPADAAYTNVSGQYPVQGPGGRWVPEAVGVVLSSGITVQSYKGFWGSLRLRAFGPRNLTSDAIYRSSSTVLLNGEVGYHISKDWSVLAQLFNLLNRYDHDIDYAYISRITPTDAAAFTDVFHPVEPFQLRVGLKYTFGSNRF
ncbi:MAG: TonB-dependent receptor [Candidatus Korobacteraceae bacterium]